MTHSKRTAEHARLTKELRDISSELGHSEKHDKESIKAHVEHLRKIAQHLEGLHAND